MTLKFMGRRWKQSLLYISILQGTWVSNCTKLGIFPHRYCLSNKLFIPLSLQLVPELYIWLGVMVAWTGIEQFRVGRFDPPPPAEEPEDFVVCLNILITCDCIPWLSLILVFSGSCCCFCESVRYKAKMAIGRGACRGKKWSSLLKNSANPSVSDIPHSSVSSTAAIACMIFESFTISCMEMIFKCWNNQPQPQFKRQLQNGMPIWRT